jgi:hypothetical protein
MNSAYRFEFCKHFFNYTNRVISIEWGEHVIREQSGKCAQRRATIKASASVSLRTGPHSATASVDTLIIFAWKCHSAPLELTYRHYWGSRWVLLVDLSGNLNILLFVRYRWISKLFHISDSAAKFRFGQTIQISGCLIQNKRLYNVRLPQIGRLSYLSASTELMSFCLFHHQYRPSYLTLVISLETPIWFMLGVILPINSYENDPQTDLSLLCYASWEQLCICHFATVYESINNSIWVEITNFDQH